MFIALSSPQNLSDNLSDKFFGGWNDSVDI
jgi:hypothetical protein